MYARQNFVLTDTDCKKQVKNTPKYMLHKVDGNPVRISGLSLLPNKIKTSGIIELDFYFSSNNRNKTVDNFKLKWYFKKICRILPPLFCTRSTKLERCSFDFENEVQSMGGSIFCIKRK